MLGIIFGFIILKLMSLHWKTKEDELCWHMMVIQRDSGSTDCLDSIANGAEMRLTLTLVVSSMNYLKQLRYLGDLKCLQFG